MRAPLLALAVLAGACGGEYPQQEGVVRSDSAGVRLIVSTGEDRPLPWRLDSVDVLRDSLGEPWLFTNITPQMVITDRAGRTYVLDRAERMVRRFGRDGRHEMSFGRQGDGPGEMRFPGQLLQQGDSIAVVDPFRRAVIRWNSSFEPIKEMPLTGTFEYANALAFRFGGVWVQRSEVDSVGRVIGLYLDTLAAEPWFAVVNAQPKAIEICGRNLVVEGAGFFATAQVWAHSGPRMLAARGPAYDLWLFEGTRPIAAIRRDIPVRAPTLDDAVRLMPDGFNGAGCALTAQEFAEKVGMAATMPLVNALALLSDGTMWAQRTYLGESPVVLDVFGSDGAYAGTVSNYRLPVGVLPSDEVLMPRDDEESGGVIIQRTRIVR